MKKIDDNTLQFTRQELADIYNFIDSSLDRAWDAHTSNYICEDSWEDGKRRMNPQAYDLAQEMCQNLHGYDADNSDTIDDRVDLIMI